MEDFYIFGDTDHRLLKEFFGGFLVGPGEREVIEEKPAGIECEEMAVGFLIAAGHRLGQFCQRAAGNIGLRDGLSSHREPHADRLGHDLLTNKPESRSAVSGFRFFGFRFFS